MAYCTRCGRQLLPNGTCTCQQAPAGMNQGYNNAPNPDLNDYSTYSTASGRNDLPYVVMQVTLKEKFLGTGSGNLTALEEVINRQASLGYRLHTITTASATSQGFFGGDRIQATMVFEKIR